MNEPQINADERQSHETIIPNKSSLTLEYAAPEKQLSSNSTGWMVAVSTGVPVGVLLGQLSAHGATCLGTFSGFAIGIAVGYAAKSHKLFIIGLVGNCLAALCCLITALLRDELADISNNLANFFPAFLILIAFFGIPGLIGGVMTRKV